MEQEQLAAVPAEAQERQGGAKLWSSCNGRFEIREHKTEPGPAIYCGKIIEPIPAVALILSINHPYAALDRALKNGEPSTQPSRKTRRHRTPAQLFYDTFASRGIKGNLEAEKLIVKAAQPLWLTGHPLLEAVAWECHLWGGSWPAEAAQQIFGDRYFAASRPHSLLQQIKYRKQERLWEQEGRQRLPRCFSRFGVISAECHFRLRYELARHEVFSCRGRKPTRKEAALVEVLNAGLAILAPELASEVSRSQIRLRIRKSDILKGYLRNWKGDRVHAVYLSHRLFTCGFPEALAAFVHEHAHVLGADGSRDFTDALTEMLEEAIGHRDELSPLEAEWVRLRGQS